MYQKQANIKVLFSFMQCTFTTYHELCCGTFKSFSCNKAKNSGLVDFYTAVLLKYVSLKVCNPLTITIV